MMSYFIRLSPVCAVALFAASCATPKEMIEERRGAATARIELIKQVAAHAKAQKSPSERTTFTKPTVAFEVCPHLGYNESCNAKLISVRALTDPVHFRPIPKQLGDIDNYDEFVSHPAQILERGEFVIDQRIKSATVKSVEWKDRWSPANDFNIETMFGRLFRIRFLLVSVPRSTSSAPKLRVDGDVFVYDLGTKDQLHKAPVLLGGISYRASAKRGKSLVYASGPNQGQYAGSTKSGITNDLRAKIYEGLKPNLPEARFPTAW